MNVYEATNARLKTIFEEFDNVYVSFSGGKDSGVMLNATVEFIKKNYPGRKLGVFHIDYEAQYQMTTDYVDSELSKHSEILEVYRICLPIAASCATSMHQGYWIPWDKDNKDLWVRDLPANGITKSNHEFEWFTKGMWDYELQERFSGWLHTNKNAKKMTLSAFIDLYDAYPVFDWKVEDVWIANGKFEWDYNKLYDLFYKAGVPYSKMRVASPFHDCGIENLKLYKVIDPKNWAKMVGRTNGVNFAGIYGGTTAMGWRSIKLPKGHTWKSYMEFILKTLPPSHLRNG